MCQLLIKGAGHGSGWASSWEGLALGPVSSAQEHLRVKLNTWGLSVWICCVREALGTRPRRLAQRKERSFGVNRPEFQISTLSLAICVSLCHLLLLTTVLRRNEHYFLLKTETEIMLFFVELFRSLARIRVILAQRRSR